MPPDAASFQPTSINPRTDNMLSSKFFLSMEDTLDSIITPWLFHNSLRIFKTHFKFVNLSRRQRDTTFGGRAAGIRTASGSA